MRPIHPGEILREEFLAPLDLGLVGWGTAHTRRGITERALWHGGRDRNDPGH